VGKAEGEKGIGAQSSATDLHPTSQPAANGAGAVNTLTRERQDMAQVLTVASIVALVRWLGWRHAERLFEGGRQPAGPAGPDTLADIPPDPYVDKASAHDFLVGAADLTFGMVILGLGFFLLLWVIATG
jgi:hypothetical protein